RLAPLRHPLAPLAAVPCSQNEDKLNVWRNEKLLRVRRILDHPDAPLSPEDLSALNDKPGNLGSKKSWDGREKEVRSRLKMLLERFAGLAVLFEQPGELDAQAAAALATLTQLADRAIDLYAAEKRRRGVLDFTDLLLHAGRLLRTQPAVRKAMADQLSQLLIDEAQDTDAFQIRLLTDLAFADAPNELPPGRLFLVGDAKQSIYRFRGARVEVFEDLCRRLGETQVEDLNLSFRTHRAGVEFVNAVFAPLMGDAYTPIRASREQSPPGASVELLLAEGPPEDPILSAASACRAQARATAQRIAEMLSGERTVWDSRAGDWRAARAGDIAILFSRMTVSAEYERELAERGIPYYVVAGSGFFRQQEVYDVLNVLRVIDNPADDVSLFGVLRSSLFGLDDDALMRLARACPSPRFESLQGGAADEILPPGQAQTLRFAVDLLTRLSRDKDAVGPAALIERLLDATAYEATMLAQFHGRRMLGNVRRLIDLARQAHAGGLALGDFLAETDELVLDDTRYEQAAVAGEAEDVVRLMTVHKAKGLEFPIVFLPDLNAGRRSRTLAILSRDDWGLTCKLAPADSDEEESDSSDQGDAPLSYRIARQLEDADDRAEDIRRLYVAATRHEDRLVLVGADCRTKDGDRFNDGSRGGTDNSLNLLNGVLGILKAVDGGQTTIPYGDGFEMAVRKIAPTAPVSGRRGAPAGRVALAKADSPEALAQRMSRAGDAAAPPLVGPLPADQAARVEIAVTALGDFAACPMLYRWRHELRIPRNLEGRRDNAARRVGTLDAATLGTLYHRCMELLDPVARQNACSLVAQAIAEMDLHEQADADALAAELETMLQAFRAHGLADELAKARRVYRELDFVLQAGPAVLRGQIDVLFQDRAGAWHIVDYKSDRVAPEHLTDHAAGYELQMHSYSLAAGRFLQSPPPDARLYFLRAGRDVPVASSPETLDRAGDRLVRLAGELIAARRSGTFTPRVSSRCAACPYAALCPGETVA
ncbi:MAG TPA: PD-(D/E)XK nuclease family protein, partial [Phycisphaerae bacterium]|nr:PD-(D/E)XK nuclease family protein [Phycisphaerae bacterium]